MPESIVGQRCVLCGEKFRSEDDEVAEAYDPTQYEGDYDNTPNGLVHGECMIQAGWVMS